MDIAILYQDGALAVCIKPAGVLSEEGGMPELLRARTGAERIFCVHRLDRETAGLMVYAKTRDAAAKLSAAITDGRFRKEYLAVVEGRPDAEGIMRDFLFRDAAKNKSYAVKRPRRGVREAELRFRLLRQERELALVRVLPVTGRSHQIRVQFASRGMPLAGDPKYGSHMRGCSLALWSAVLAFPHPTTGEALRFEAPPPEQWPWSLFKVPQDAKPDGRTAIS